MNTKDYFISIKQGFFLLIAALTIFNFVLQEFYYDDHRPWTFRHSIISIAIAFAIFKKKWIIVATLIIVAAILIQILIFI
jgi:hypothetical protein